LAPDLGDEFEGVGAVAVLVMDRSAGFVGIAVDRSPVTLERVDQARSLVAVEVDPREHESRSLDAFLHIVSRDHLDIASQAP
jgi:hypothetical protein